MLKKISSDHNRWYSMALSICGDEQLSMDIVQEMYLRIDKYVKDESKVIDENGDVNPFYIYVTIKNIYFKMFNDSKRVKLVQLRDDDFFYEYEFDDQSNILTETVEDENKKQQMEEAFQKTVDRIMQEAKSWHWYDEKLFKLYFLTDMSLRDVAKKTNISLTSIYNSVKNYKEFMTEKFSEDVEDFYNGDYDKI